MFHTMCMNTLPVWMCTHHRLVEVRRGQWISWKLSDRRLWTLCGCWGPHCIPLQEQQALLTCKPSLQTLVICSSLYLHYYEINLLPYFERLTKQRFSKPIEIIAWSEAKLSPPLLFSSGAPGTPVWDVH